MSRRHCPLCGRFMAATGRFAPPLESDSTIPHQAFYCRSHRIGMGYRVFVMPTPESMAIVSATTAHVEAK